jgi:hypothetical protein
MIVQVVVGLRVLIFAHGGMLFLDFNIANGIGFCESMQT